jgi:Fic family protein
MTQLPVIHSDRPAYDWVNRLQAMREAYEAALAVSPASPDRAAHDAVRFDAWLVYHSLRLRGSDVTLDEVEGARAGDVTPVPAIVDALAAVARVRAAAVAGEELTPALLVELNGLVDPRGGGKLREGPPVIVYQGHEPPGPGAVPALLENAAEWFVAGSFVGEFHPVEQAALALVRICDIQPFPSNNEMTARIAVSLFPLRAGWPPIIVRDEYERDYRKAILHAIHMDTRHLVELLAKCVAKAYDEAMGWGIDATLNQ